MVKRYLCPINHPSTNQYCLISYNSRGFGKEKIRFCDFLLSREFVGNKSPILLNQENFILRGNVYKIQQAFPDMSFIIKPAIKENIDKGRPRGGMFISFPIKLKKFIFDVSPSHWRVQAVVISCSNSKLLVVNSYFPVDDHHNIEELT